MAIAKNSLMMQASGSVGKQIVFKQYHDKTVVSKMPDMSKRVLSEKQLKLNERLAEANFYAREVYQTEEGKLKARLRLKLESHKSLFHALVKEYMVNNGKV